MEMKIIKRLMILCAFCQLITVSVQASPNGNDDTAQVIVGQTVTIDVLANDTGNNLTIDFAGSSVAYPARKADFKVVNNKLVYTNNPAANGNAITGEVTIYYIMKDGQNRTNWATARINVTESEGLSTAIDDIAEVSTGGSASIDVLANDVGANLRIVNTVTAWPVERERVQVVNNKLVYTHASTGQGGYPVNGTATIYYGMQDSSGRETWATLKVSIVGSQGIKTYILAGQSNAGGFGLGYGTVPFGTLIPNEDLDAVGRSDLKVAQPSANIFSRWFATWRDLEPGFGAGGNGIRFGPELTFNSQLQSVIDEPVRIIKYTAGGTTMFSDWQPNAGNNTYSDFLETINDAKVAASGLGITLDIKGLLLVQGESDAFGQQEPPAYQGKLQSFISGLRTDLNLPDLKVHIAEIPDSYRLASREQIWAAQAAVAASDSNAYLVRSKSLELFTDDGYGTDQIHWSTQGNLRLGELFANSVVTAESLN